MFSLIGGIAGEVLKTPSPGSSPIGNGVPTELKPPIPFLPTPSSKLSFELGRGMGVAKDERGLPKNSFAKAHIRYN